MRLEETAPLTKRRRAGSLQLAMIPVSLLCHSSQRIACYGNTLYVQDVWDWMAQHWCDRGQTLWPVEQMDNPPLEIYRPANFMGAVYNKVRLPGVYTRRSLFYAQLFHQFKSGHDPHNEMDWDAVLAFCLPFPVPAKAATS
jgi:hypothetical protein